MADKLKLTLAMRQMLLGAISDKEKSVKRLNVSRPQYAAVFEGELVVLADCRKWLAEQV